VEKQKLGKQKSGFPNFSFPNFSFARVNAILASRLVSCRLHFPSFHVRRRLGGGALVFAPLLPQHAPGVMRRPPQPEAAPDWVCPHLTPRIIA